MVILLEEIIERNMPSLFLNYDVVTCPFASREMPTIDEEEAVDLLEEIQKQLRNTSGRGHPSGNRGQCG